MTFRLTRRHMWTPFITRPQLKPQPVFRYSQYLTCLPSLTVPSSGHLNSARQISPLTLARLHLALYIIRITSLPTSLITVFTFLGSHSLGYSANCTYQKFNLSTLNTRLRQLTCIPFINAIYQSLPFVHIKVQSVQSEAPGPVGLSATNCLLMYRSVHTRNPQQVPFSLILCIYP